MSEQQDIVQVMDIIKQLSDDMLSMAITLIESEQRIRADEAKELKDDEMDYEAKADALNESNDD